MSTESSKWEVWGSRIDDGRKVSLNVLATSPSDAAEKFAVLTQNEVYIEGWREHDA